MSQILRGKDIADNIVNQCKSFVDGLDLDTRKPRLAVIGDKADTASNSYLRGIQTKADKIGIEVDLHGISEETSQKKLLDLVQKLNQDVLVDAILLLTPLPKGYNLDENAAKNTIAADKDVDGTAKFSEFMPCTAEACMKFLYFNKYDIEGREAVVVGRSSVVGKPVADMLLKDNATVTICHSRTKELSNVIKRANIVIVAVGKPKMLDVQCFKQGQIVIDAGINWDAGAKKICGDVDFDSVEPIVRAITPVPGGVGSVTSAVLMEHIIKAYKNHN